MRFITRVAVVTFFLVLLGCSADHVTKPEDLRLPPPEPVNVIQRMVLSYEQKKAPEYQACFTGDFTYEFSNATDPTLVQQYSTGWFKADERQSSLHLFNGYTESGGSMLPAASTIGIKLAVTTPTDDNTEGLDPRTHKVLATRVDGMILVPQSDGELLTYAIQNNFNVFYVVRGDVAVNLDYTQPADSLHWYVYRWVDLTATSSARMASSEAPVPTTPVTWGKVKARYR